MPMQPDAMPMQPDAMPMQSDAMPMQSDAMPMQPDAMPMQSDAMPMQPDAFKNATLLRKTALSEKMSMTLYPLISKFCGTNVLIYLIVNIYR